MTTTTKTITQHHAHADGHEDDGDEDRDVAIASLLDDDEDRDIQAMILGDVEGIEIESMDGEDADEEGADEESAEPSEAGEASASGESASGTESGSAAVRERGDRFPHRVSRRRRGRGGNRGGDRGQEARGLETRTQEPRTGEARSGEARTQEPRTDGRSEGRHERTVSRPNTNQPSIADLLKEGQEIIVQIAKEPLGQKGARITSHIALPGRYVVYMPTLEHMGVSRKSQATTNACG